MKVGFDPSAPDLHLGHTVVFRKMRHFQELGHEVVFLIGDFTGMIGDPTGKKADAPAAHARTRCSRTPRPTRRRSSRSSTRRRPSSTSTPSGSRRSAPREWSGSRRSTRSPASSSATTSRSASRRRSRSPSTSSSTRSARATTRSRSTADVELGGTDQLFNLLVGRDLMREWGQEPQVVMTLPLLVGTDGVEKMSKSLGQPDRRGGAARRDLRQGHVDLRRHHVELLDPPDRPPALRDRRAEGRGGVRDAPPEGARRCASRRASWPTSTARKPPGTPARSSSGAFPGPRGP